MCVSDKCCKSYSKILFEKLLNYSAAPALKIMHIFTLQTMCLNYFSEVKEIKNLKLIVSLKKWLGHEPSTLIKCIIRSFSVLRKTVWLITH